MNEMLNLFRGALLLDAKTFADLKASPDVFRKGFTLLVLIGLIVGLVTGLVGIVRGLTTDPAAEIRQSREEMQRMMELFMLPEALQQMLDRFVMVSRIAERIAREMRSPLPDAVGVVFKQLGAMVSQPFSWLGSLLFYGALVQIFAKLLGGRGTIAQMWGVTALTVAPHILDALFPLLNLVPAARGCLSSLVWLTAFVWGVVVYVKATAVAHEMSNGRALMAVLLPIIAAILLGLVLILVLVLLIVLSSAGR